MPSNRVAKKPTGNPRGRPRNDRAAAQNSNTTTTSDQGGSQDTTGDAQKERRLKRAEARAADAEEVRALLEQEVEDLQLAALHKDKMVLGLRKMQRQFEKEHAEWTDKEQELTDRIDSSARDFEKERAEWKEKEKKLKDLERELKAQTQAGIEAERDSDARVQEQQQKIDCLEKELRELHDRQLRAVDDCKTAEETAARCEREMESYQREAEASRRDVERSRAELDSARSDYMHLKMDNKRTIDELEMRLAEMANDLKGFRETNDFLVNTPAGQLGQRLHDADMRIAELLRMIHHPHPPSPSINDGDRYRRGLSPNYGNDNECRGMSPNYGTDDSSFEHQQLDPRDAMIPRIDSRRRRGDSRMRDHPDRPPPAGYRHHSMGRMDRGMVDDGRDGEAWGYSRHSMDNRGGMMGGGRDGDAGGYRQHSMDNRRDGRFDEGRRDQEGFRHWHEGDMGEGRDGRRDGYVERLGRHHSVGNMGDRFDGRDGNAERFRHNMGGGMMMNDGREDSQARFRHPMDSMGGGMMQQQQLQHDERDGSQQQPPRDLVRRRASVSDQNSTRNNPHATIELDEDEEPMAKRRRETMGGGGESPMNQHDDHAAAAASTVAMMGGQEVFRVGSEQPSSVGNTTTKKVKREAPEQSEDFTHPDDSDQGFFEAHNRMVVRLAPKEEE